MAEVTVEDVERLPEGNCAVVLNQGAIFRDLVAHGARIEQVWRPRVVLLALQGARDVEKAWLGPHLLRCNRRVTIGEPAEPISRLRGCLIFDGVQIPH